MASDALPVNAEVIDQQLPAIRPAAELTQPRSVEEMIGHVGLIQDVMAHTMRKDVHYGVIPGTGTKPTLLKAGAEKLSLTFRLRPKFTIERLDLSDGHRELIVTCNMYNSAGGHEGQGVGSCSTMESKYRWRKEERTCPTCGKAAIIKGKAEYGGGWLCWAKKEGCGGKWADGAQEIESQQVGRVENPDIADVYNTVLKMAKKRAQVDATLTATAASDLFTQDVEDMRQESPAVENSRRQPTRGVDPPQWEESAPWNNDREERVVPATIDRTPMTPKDLIKPAAKPTPAKPKDTGPDLGARLLELCEALEGNANKGAQLAEKLSGFKGKDGEWIPGVPVAKLSPGRLKVTYAKAKAKYDEEFGSAAADTLFAGQEAPETAPAQNAAPKTKAKPAAPDSALTAKQRQLVGDALLKIMARKDEDGNDVGMAWVRDTFCPNHGDMQFEKLDEELESAPPEIIVDMLRRLRDDGEIED